MLNQCHYCIVVFVSNTDDSEVICVGGGLRDEERATLTVSLGYVGVEVAGDNPAPARSLAWDSSR